MSWRSNVYIQRTKYGTFIFLGLYVDDLVIVSPNLAYLEQSKAELANEFAMIDSGNLSYCFGTQVMRWRESKSILLTQAKDILDILTQFPMSDCKHVFTPMPFEVKLTKIMSPVIPIEQFDVQNVPYATIVGKFMYLVIITWPYLAYVVSHYTQCMANLGPLHWVVVKRIFCYLKHLNI